MTLRRLPRTKWVWSALALIAVVAVTSGSFRLNSPASASNVSEPASATALQGAFISVLSQVRSSVVEVATSEDLGSGVIYDNDGDIVTNAHVVNGKTTFQVTLSDGRTVPGTLVGQYTPSDLAVVRVSAAKLPPAATFADSSKVQVGDIVLAIGNPLGLSSTVTQGIVSATGRTVSEGNGVVLPATIQTSAAINPGNSGGGLVNLDAQVVGIPTLAATDPEFGNAAAAGIGFAIPSNTVKLIAEQLIATGAVTNSDRASLGITGATAMTISGRKMGVLVRSVKEPASSAGIHGGDVITRVNATPTPTLTDLQTELAGLAPGQRATVRVLHPSGAKQSITVVLGTL